MGPAPPRRKRTRPPAEAASGATVKKVGLITLCCVTAFVLVAAPSACVVFGVGENLSGDPAGYKSVLYSLSALVAVAAIWAVVLVIFLMS